MEGNINQPKKAPSKKTVALALAGVFCLGIGGGVFVTKFFSEERGADTEVIRESILVPATYETFYSEIEGLLLDFASYNQSAKDSLTNYVQNPTDATTISLYIETVDRGIDLLEEVQALRPPKEMEKFYEDFQEDGRMVQDALVDLRNFMEDGGTPSPQNKDFATISKKLSDYSNYFSETAALMLDHLIEQM